MGHMHHENGEEGAYTSNSEYDIALQSGGINIMQPTLYPYNNPYPYGVPYVYAAPPKKEQSGLSITLHVLGGVFLGALPFLIMLTFTILTFVAGPTNLALACNVYMSGAISGFLYATPVVLLIAVVCLFLKRRRWIGLALPIWVVSLIPAFYIFIILAFSSDSCIGV